MLTNQTVWALRERLRMRRRRSVDNPAARRAAVLVPLMGKEDDPDVLCFERSDSVFDHKGEICFPGGSLEAHDRGPVEAALREAHEELNLRPDDVELIGMLDDVETIVSNFTITPVVGFTARRPELVPDPSEVSRIIIVPLATLLDPNVEAAQWLEYKGTSKLGYSYSFGGNRIWGATGRIVRSLVNVWRGDEG